MNPRSLRPRAQAIDDLLYALLSDFASAVIAEGMAHAGKQQPQIVVDFRDGSYRRARIARSGLLLDRDGRRQAFDGIDVRLFHLLEKLARIGRQRLDITALAFGIDCVKG